MTTTIFQRDEAITLIEDATDLNIQHIAKNELVLEHVPFDIVLPIRFKDNQPTITITDFCLIFMKEMGGEGQPLFDAHGEWQFIHHHIT